MTTFKIQMGPHNSGYKSQWHLHVVQNSTYRLVSKTKDFSIRPNQTYGKVTFRFK